jgi:hypothetical protein
METTREEIKYQCKYCNKIYIRKYAYNNHFEKCKFYKSRCSVIKEDNHEFLNNIKETNINLSNSTIYKMLIDLTNKYDKLQKDYDNLKKFVETNKKKVDIITYLNNNFNFDNYDFNDFIKSIIITSEDLEIIFKKDYLDGIVNIILNKINILENNVPLKAFSTKENILYIYLKSLKSWIQISNEELQKTIKYFSKNILNEFGKWESETKKTMRPDDFSEIYILNMKKVLGGNYDSKNLNNLIKTRLYKNIKINVKSISSYEII